MDNFDIPLENILQINLEAMIRTHYLAFSVESYTELSDCRPELCETYILENKDAFLSNIATIPLKKETFENLVISKQTSPKFKESIVNHHGDKLMSESVAEQICSLQLSVTKEVFDAAWNILDMSKKEKLMLTHLSILKAKDFEACFTVLGKPYRDLTDRSRRHNALIPDSEEHQKLAKRLLQVDYITSYESAGFNKEYDHELRKMVDRPVILCRVKVDNSNKRSENKQL